MRLCTATIHHGSYFEQFTGFGDTEDSAFDAAVIAQGTGYQPSRANDASVHVLLHRLHSGDWTDGGTSDGNVTMTIEDGEAKVHVGWVTYTWTSVRLWAVTATINSQLTQDGWSSTRQVPTFYLDPAVQGITSAGHAERIAEEILRSLCGDAAGVTVSIHVEPIA